MANTKSAKAKIRKDRKRTQLNRFWKNRVKNVLKELEAVFEKKDKNKAKKILNQAKSILDKTSRKRIIHRNKARRIKSKWERRLSSL